MEKYHLTPNELLVLLFLARDNGGCNTARDIAQYEGCPRDWLPDRWRASWKSSFLWWKRDAADKRICHLYLTQQCSALTEQMTEKKLRFSAGWRRYSGGSDCDDGTDTAQVYGKYISIY